MFKSNKYTKWYYRIIDNALLRATKQDEIHHIIPRCLGGSDVNNNLVHLTYREHYIVHALLCKMHDSKMLINALWQMSNKNKSKYYNSNLYRVSRSLYIDRIKGDNHWSKADEFRHSVSISWTDERKSNFSNLVSGDNHWTKKCDMSIHSSKMREHLTTEMMRENGLKSTFVTNNPMKNPEIAAKYKKPKEKVVCPHCGKIGGKPVMYRYHFDNCKNKILW